MAASKFWSTPVLYILWVVRLLVAIVLLALYAKAYSDDKDGTTTTLDMSDGYTSTTTTFHVSKDSFDGAFGIVVAFCSVSIVLDLLSIILLCMHKLHAVFYLVANIVALLIWAVYFVVSVVAVSTEDGDYGVALIIPAVLLLAASKAAFIYGCYKTHQWRQNRRVGFGNTKAGAPYDPHAPTPYTSQPSAQYA